MVVKVSGSKRKFLVNQHFSTSGEYLNYSLTLADVTVRGILWQKVDNQQLYLPTRVITIPSHYLLQGFTNVVAKGKLPTQASREYNLRHV